MPDQRPVTSPPVASSTSSDQDDRDSSSKQPVKETATVTNLATAETQRMEAALGDYVLRFLRLRKGPRKDIYDLDAVATQPSIWDAENVEELKSLHIHPQWENWSAFDPSFRWSWREENAVRRKVDWKIMVWVCIMFAALNIDRNNISNAVSDNMLDDIGITRVDYNLGQTISRVGFLVAELPSQLISKRIGPDLWIPIQICIFSLISAMQFFLKGRASFLATRYLIATFQGGFIPDTILYLSYFYTGKSLPIRLAWFWMSSQLIDIAVGFAAVGLVSMRGILGYEGWRWLFLIEGMFTFTIGLMSFFLMPQCPTKTKSWWNPKGYFNTKEQKIIVNSGKLPPYIVGMYTLTLTCSHSRRPSQGWHVQPARSYSRPNLEVLQRLRHVASVRLGLAIRYSQVPSIAIPHIVVPRSRLQRHPIQPAIDSIHRGLQHHDAFDHCIQ